MSSPAAVAELRGCVDVVAELFDDTWLDAWNANLADPPSTEDIWKIVGPADSMLLAALLAPDGGIRRKLDGVLGAREALKAAMVSAGSTYPDESRRAAIATRYVEAVSVGRDERSWQSIVDNVRTLATIAAHADLRAVADWLNALEGELRQSRRA
jgi:hypothetical protein